MTPEDLLQKIEECLNDPDRERCECLEIIAAALRDAEKGGRLEGLRDMLTTLNRLRYYTEQIPCPDEKPGCLTMHTRQVQRVPVTRMEIFDAIRAEIERLEKGEKA